MIVFAFAVLYATIGVRFGFLPDIPMTYWNAEGTNTYPISIRLTNATITIKLDATINSGRTTVNLIGSNGVIAWQRKLEPGRTYQESQTIPIAQPGFYNMVVQFERSSGRLNLSWQLFGNF
jgi:hypothetical protein